MMMLKQKMLGCKCRRYARALETGWLVDTEQRAEQEPKVESNRQWVGLGQKRESRVDRNSILVMRMIMRIETWKEFGHRLCRVMVVRTEQCAK